MTLPSSAVLQALKKSASSMAIRDTPFIYNEWYVAAFAHEVGRDFLARILLGKRVVLFRTETGQAVALADRCAHRAYPLSLGKLEGDTIVCGYHGFRFNTDGNCVEVPSSSKCPKELGVARYKVAERGPLIWIWMGDPALADAAKIIQYPWHRDPAWAYKGKCTTINAHYQLLYDNLMDLSHVGYVHKNTIGGEPEAHSNAQMKTTRTADGVHVIRWLLDSTPPPTYSAMFDFKGRVDRWIEIEFSPGAVRLYTGAKDAGAGAYEGNRDGGLGLRTLHAITPSTPDSTYYFWSIARNVKLDNQDIHEKVFRQIEATFHEDKLILESQHQRLKQRPDPLVDIAADAGAVQARRVITERIKEEAAVRSPSIS